MANNRNEIDSETNRTEQTDCFAYCNIPNTTNEDLSENYKFFRKILKYLTRFVVQIIQSKKMKFIIRKRSVSTPCKPEEEITACTSLSSIGKDIIKPDAKAIVRIKQKVINAITFTRSGEDFDKVKYEKLPCVVKHFVHGASYRYAEYATQYVDVPERGCGCIGTRTQSDIVDGEFSSETSPDAFAKACKKGGHADFILKEIAKVSDALMEKARFVSAAAGKETGSIHAPVSVTSMRGEMREEIFESTKPLVSSIIHAEEESTPVTMAATAVTIIHPEMLTNTGTCIPMSPSNHFAQDTQHSSARFDKSLDVPDIQVIPSIKYLRKNEHRYTRTVSIMFPERDDFRNTIVTDVATKDRRKEKAEEEKEDSPKLCKESVLFKYKKPKYRAKYRISAADVSRAILDTFIEHNTYAMKKRKMSQFKEIYTDEMSKYARLSFPSSKAIRDSRFFNYFKRPATGIYQDDRSRPPRIVQPTKHCEDLISNNIYLRKPKCCDTWTTPCFSSQNKATLNVTLSHAHCCLPQNSCATDYRTSCHSLIDSHASSRYYNINADCVKHRITFGNSLYTNTYCKSGAKYCYPHLNNIDNIQMGYYHCNDSCPVWNNNQHCGRDRSYYCTKGNLYFMHPWPSKYLLRYN